MKKSQIILIIVLILILGGVIFWKISQKPKTYSEKEENTPTPTLTPTATPQASGEIYSFSAIVLRVNATDNFLIVKREGEMTEIKVLLSKETNLTKLGVPSNAPKEGIFIPTENKIKISGIKLGDKIFIKAKSNIAGKTEFDDIEYVEVFP